MKARALVAVAALLPGVLVAPPALAGGAGATIAADDPVVAYGEPVALTVTLGGDTGCASGRAVTLEWRPAGSAAFATVAQGTTATDGTVSFVQTQPYTGRYRAQVASGDGCPAGTTDEVPVRVRALVDGSVVTGSAEAGSCVDVAATVAPPKPGQMVELQRKRDGVWSTIDTLALDAGSSALARPCFGFDDMGVVRLRVRWVAQDVLNETNATPQLAFELVPAPWMEEIDAIVDGRSVSISVGEEGEYLYRRADDLPRTPASNTKLLLAMAMLDTFGPAFRIRTRAAAVAVEDGVVRGDLWILGRGDPRVGPETMRALAERIAAAGVRRVTGAVMGGTGYFERDWSAPGWNDVARDYLNRPTALTFNGNEDRNPEREAARSLTKQLAELGVRVAGEPGAGSPPSGLQEVTHVPSERLVVLLRKTLVPSDNFAAEVLGKRLGAQVHGPPGTIAKGAAAIEAWTDGNGADVELFDSSGLSYDNRVTAAGIVRLLWVAEDSSWGAALRRALPAGGRGTLRDRLTEVRVRAKTGTLSGISALSGWVWSERLGTWVEFSILSAGLSKATASDLEDRIVRILQDRAG